MQLCVRTCFPPTPTSRRRPLLPPLRAPPSRAAGTLPHRAPAALLPRPPPAPRPPHGAAGRPARRRAARPAAAPARAAGAAAAAAPEGPGQRGGGRRGGGAVNGRESRAGGAYWPALTQSSSVCVCCARSARCGMTQTQTHERSAQTRKPLVRCVLPQPGPSTPFYMMHEKATHPYMATTPTFGFLSSSRRLSSSCSRTRRALVSAASSSMGTSSPSS